MVRIDRDQGVSAKAIGDWIRGFDELVLASIAWIAFVLMMMVFTLALDEPPEFTLLEEIFFISAFCLFISVTGLILGKYVGEILDIIKG